MADLDRQSPERCVQRIENAIGIIGQRLNPNGMDLVPQAKSTDLMRMILLDAASLLDHFHTEEARDA